VVQKEDSASLCLSGKFYDIAFGFTNLAPTIAAIRMKNKTTKPPHMPANMYSMWVFDATIDPQRRNFMTNNMYTWIQQMLNP